MVEEEQGDWGIEKAIGKRGGGETRGKGKGKWGRNG